MLMGGWSPRVFGDDGRSVNLIDNGDSVTLLVVISIDDGWAVTLMVVVSGWSITFDE